MSSFLLLILTAVFASEESTDNGNIALLGTCAIYSAAYPGGHTDDDLSIPIFSLLNLPESITAEIGDDWTSVQELTTEQFLTIYELQEEFCHSTGDLWEPVLAELQSEEEISEESMEVLEVMLFEIVVFLYEQSAVTGRRQLAAQFAVFASLGIVFLVGFYVVFKIAQGCKGTLPSLEWQAVRVKMAAAAAAVQHGGSRLLRRRRALTELSTVDITTETLLSACGHNIPSFVCSMSTLALGQVLTSQFCGGSSTLSTCAYNTQYALGYVASGVQNAMSG